MTEDLSLKPLPQPRTGLGGLLVGASYPFQALSLFLRTPELRRYIFFPILLNLFLGITLYAGLLTGGLRAIDALIAAIPTWFSMGASHTPHLEVDWTAWLTALPAGRSALFHWLTAAFHWPSHWSISVPSWLPLPSLPNLPGLPNLPDLSALPHFSLPHLPALPLPALHLPALHLPDLTSWLPHWSEIELPTVRLPRFIVPNWFRELPEFGLALVIGLFRLLLMSILLLITGFILLQFGVLLGSPWYGQLSEKLEKMQTGRLQVVPVHPLREIGRAILYELKKLVLLIVIGVPLLLVHLFPGPGTLVATSGGIALTATLVCLDFLDGALERRRLRFRQKLGVVWHGLPTTAGFALSCLTLISIPFFNLLSIPVCVAAGTLFFCDQVLPGMEFGKSPRAQPTSLKQGS